MAIYRRLFFNNVESFLSNGFPVLCSCYAEADWLALVRDFLRRHECHTPYFHGIGSEFLAYLNQTRVLAGIAADPPFMIELSHYEWIELALDRAEGDLEQASAGLQRDGDLRAGHPVVSPLACSLAYAWPVHRIGAKFRPSEPGADKTYLVVYRNREDRVRFMEANAPTAMLLEMCESLSDHSGAAILARLAEQIGGDREAVVGYGLETLQRMLELDIVLGVDVAGAADSVAAEPASH